MTTPARRLARFCRHTLGPCTIHPAPARRPGQSHVIHVTDLAGRRFVTKVHTAVDKYRQEVHAYTHWTPALGDHAPRLIGADADLAAILLTALPGEPADHPADPPATQACVYRQAGTLLRRLHESEPPTALPDFAERLAVRLEWWLTTAHGLLTTFEQQLVRRHLAALADLPAPSGVPCHLDYQPHNWLIDHTGTLRVIDFEHARVDAAPRDLVRLAFRHWTNRPERRAAFLDGYGRQLTDTERQVLIHCAALDAVTCLARADDTANPRLAEHGRATLRRLPPPP